MHVVQVASDVPGLPLPGQGVVRRWGKGCLKLLHSRTCAWLQALLSSRQSMSCVPAWHCTCCSQHNGLLVPTSVWAPLPQCIPVRASPTAWRCLRLFHLHAPEACPFMTYGELVRRWRVSRRAKAVKWPKEVAEEWGPWLLLAGFVGIVLWEWVS